MKTATCTLVDGVSAFITRLGQRQMGTELVSVAGDVCVAVPAAFVKRRVVNQDHVSRLGAAGRDSVARRPRLAIEQRAYLSAWQAEMEDFDRF